MIMGSTCGQCCHSVLNKMTNNPQYVMTSILERLFATIVAELSFTAEKYLLGMRSRGKPELCCLVCANKSCNG